MAKKIVGKGRQKGGFDRGISQRGWVLSDEQISLLLSEAGGKRLTVVFPDAQESGLFSALSDQQELHLIWSGLVAGGADGMLQALQYWGLA